MALPFQLTTTNKRPLYQNPISAYGASLINRSTPNTTGMSQAPRMSVAPISSAPVQYQSKPRVNMSTPSGAVNGQMYNIQNKPKVVPSVPLPTGAPKAGGGNTMLDYFAKQQQINREAAARREGTATNQTNAYIESLRNSYGRQANELRDSIPFLQGESERTRAELEAGAADIARSGEVQGERVRENTGTQLRQNAQSKRELDAQRQNTFASLGTLDSSEFRKMQTNADSDLLMMQDTNLKEQNNKLAEIDNAVGTAVRQAKSAIASETAKFNEAVRKINSAINASVEEKEDAIRMAYAQLEGTVAEIQNELAANNQAAQLAKLQFQQQMEVINAQNKQPQLSAEFMRTGVPQTQEDFIYKTQNAGGFADKIGATAGATGFGKVSAKDANIAQSGLATINNIRSYIQSDPGVLRSIGPGGISNPLSNQEYKSTISNASDLIGRLRSGGAINAGEEERFRKLLPNWQDTPQSAEYKLAQLENEFSNLLGGGSRASGVNDDQMQQLLQILGA